MKHYKINTTNYLWCLSLSILMVLCSLPSDANAKYSVKDLEGHWASTDTAKCSDINFGYRSAKELYSDILPLQETYNVGGTSHYEYPGDCSYHVLTMSKFANNQATFSYEQTYYPSCAGTCPIGTGGCRKQIYYYSADLTFVSKDQIKISYSSNYYGSKECIFKK